MKVFPVIASTIAANELGEFAKEKYELNENCSCKLFRTGINHTYLLSNLTTKYVIRVYSHNWRSKSEIMEEIKLLNLLSDNKLGVSFPIKDKNGEFIQEINAPEGIRYVVLFSYSQGDKIRCMDIETCFEVGSLMAKIHSLNLDKTIKRISFNKKTLIELPCELLKQFISDDFPEMAFIRQFAQNFQNSDFENIQQGVLHMDIWYDNMAITNDRVVTIFDFDFCGNGWLILDLGYFCKQLFLIEVDKKQYELKLKSFLKGYQNVRQLAEKELMLIPKAGASVFIFYLGVQAQRFDWSNIFLTENYLKMFIGRIKSWLDYYEENEMTSSTL